VASGGLTRTSRFQVEPFDLRAAIEVALMTEAELRKGRKRGDSSESWVKVKYDRQIVATAKVLMARAIYSEDRDVWNLAVAHELTAKSIADCILPYPQGPAGGGGLPFPTDE
jgi:hypothetical protein